MSDFKNGHWYTDKNGNHYFVENGQNPKEGWEASHRRKMIDQGKYKVSEDGNEWNEVSKEDYDKYEADENELDATTDDDFGFDEEEEVIIKENDYVKILNNRDGAIGKVLSINGDVAEVEYETADGITRKDYYYTNELELSDNKGDEGNNENKDNSPRDEYEKNALEEVASTLQYKENIKDTLEATKEDAYESYEMVYGNEADDYAKSMIDKLVEEAWNKQNKDNKSEDQEDNNKSENNLDDENEVTNPEEYHDYFEIEDKDGKSHIFNSREDALEFREKNGLTKKDVINQLLYKNGNYVYVDNNFDFNELSPQHKRYGFWHGVGSTYSGPGPLKMMAGENSNNSQNIPNKNIPDDVIKGNAERLGLKIEKNPNGGYTIEASDGDIDQLMEILNKYYKKSNK